MKSTNKSTIKNAFKAFGIVALAALIVFSMVACPDGNGGPDGGGGGGGGASGVGWPPSNVRSQYGIGGMSQPPGSGFTWVTVGADPGGKWTSALSISWSPTSSTLSTVGNWFSSNGWSGDVYYSSNVGGWNKGSQMATFQTNNLAVYNNYRN